MTYKEVTAKKPMSLTKEEKGSVIEGVYKKEVSFPNKLNKDKLSHVYTFETDNGKTIKVYGFTEMDSKFEEIEKGSYVKVTYLGKQKVPGVIQPMHKVKIEVDADRVVPAQDDHTDDSEIAY